MKNCFWVDSLLMVWVKSVVITDDFTASKNWKGLWRKVTYFSGDFKKCEFIILIKNEARPDWCAPLSRLKFLNIFRENRQRGETGWCDYIGVFNAHRTSARYDKFRFKC